MPASTVHWFVLHARSGFVPAFVLAFLAVVVVSLLTRPPAEVDLEATS